MTEDNYNYRTSQIMLRNQFPGDGPFQIPIIPKSEFSDEEFQDLRLIGFDRTHIEDDKNLDWMVHFFLYDYKFERVWKEPDRDIERLRRYRAVLTPDFSMYLEMNPTIQLYNTFRNRWCGAYFQSKGLRVIPTVNWGDENTFDFCFRGVPKGSIVAVSTYMVSEHGNRCDQKEFFLKGYHEMLRRIEPERIICYNTPFPEMEGNIVFVDYELSSWKYQGQLDNAPLSPYAKYITGCLPLPENSGIVIKQGCIIHDRAEKGSGSAYGGKWRPNPNKPNEVILRGEPNTIKRVFIPTTGKSGGYNALVKYDENGWAIKIRHFTDHLQPKYHTDPHDVEITYDPVTGIPSYSKDINYWPEDFPNGAPEFKSFLDIGGFYAMTVENNPNTLVFEYDPEEMRFKTISEFRQFIKSGQLCNIAWQGKAYHICTLWIKEERKILFAEIETEKECFFDDVDELLNFQFDEFRLRDIITKVEVWERSV